jgi:hypothetical protein
LAFEEPPAYAGLVTLPTATPVATKVTKKEKRPRSGGCFLKRIFRRNRNPKPAAFVPKWEDRSEDEQSMTEYGDGKSISDEKTAVE